MLWSTVSNAALRSNNTNSDTRLVEDIVILIGRPGSPIILVFWPPMPIPNSKGNPFSGGAKYKWVEKFGNFRLKWPSSRKRYEIDPCCYETLMRSHMRSIEWWHFQWPCRTPNPFFKVTAHLRQNYYRTLIGNHTQSIEWYHFQWPWLALNWDFKVAIFSASNIA